MLRRLWAGEVVSHDGPAGSFADVVGLARPAQEPFDVWLGGNVPAALERCGRLADGWLPALCTPGDAAAGKAVIDRVAAEHGRAISPEHFGVSLAYAPDGTDLAAPGVRRPGPSGPGPTARGARPGRACGGLRAACSSASARSGFSKFIVRPHGAAGRVAARARALAATRWAICRRDRAARADPYAAAMPERPLTLMAVHAHPDDEAIGTGGILARYSAEGVRTVLVTCTNGELGDAPGGIKPGRARPRRGGGGAAAAPGARGQLRGPGRVAPRAARLPRLGHGGLAAERRARLLLADAGGGRGGAAWPRSCACYEPQVVVTYDENGFYGHPDHIQANRVTHAAIAEWGVPDQALLHGHGPLAAARLPRHHGRGRHGGARRGAGEPRLRDARRADHDDGRLSAPSPGRSTRRWPRTPARATTSSS